MYQQHYLHVMLTYQQSPSWSYFCLHLIATITYDKERLVAMFMVEETKDYPLLYIDIWRYKVQGWMSNHFVSCYYFLLSQNVSEGNMDTSLWSNYIMGPTTSDTVTPKAWVAKLQNVLSNKNIKKDSIVYIPALVTKNHFISYG